MKKKNILRVALVSALVVGFFAACAPEAQTPQVVEQPSQPAAQAEAPVVPTPEAPPAEQGPSGTIVVAATTEPPSIVPSRHNHGAAIPGNLMTHESLFELHYETLLPSPVLVREWSAITDYLFEFTLHEGIIFHNGEAMTAEDVEASWHWVREDPSSRANHLSAQSIEVIDRYTFRISTGEPNASFFYDLTVQGNAILPKSLIESGHDFAVQPVGSGPFTFVEWRSGDFLSYTAFEDYWNPDRAARVQDVIWRIVPEGASRTIGFEMGEIDFIYDVPAADLHRFQADPNATVVMIPSPVLNFVNLNHQVPQFENVYVRRAINMAINQEEVVEGAFDGLGFPQRGQFPLAFAGTTDAGSPPFDPQGAKDLLAEHGIDPATLAFEMIATNEEGRRASEIMQAQLADIGIPMSIVMMDAPTRTQLVTQGDYEATFSPWTTGFIISALRANFLHIDGEHQNRNHMQNQEISELIISGLATVDSDARAAIFGEANRVANEYAVMVPIHRTTTIRVFNSDLVMPQLSGLPTTLNMHSAFWVE